MSIRGERPSAAKNEDEVDLKKAEISTDTKASPGRSLDSGIWMLFDLLAWRLNTWQGLLSYATVLRP